MTAINLTAEFALFPDNTQLGQSFSLGGYVFNDLSGTGSLFVNETANERGLQFSPSGVEIILPNPVKVVDLRLGAFAAPIKITILDSAGTPVRTQTLAVLNQFLHLRLVAAEIATVSLADGGNEGILARISAVFSIC